MARSLDVALLGMWGGVLNPTSARGESWNHFNFLAFHRRADRVGRRERGDLQLLIPQLALERVDPVVQVRVLVTKFKLLMPQV
ncbi:MAG TPA: hypothetical protein VFC46_03910 [Humisphaera sp.]|nr:hypothetical protein [Humisphaera sp.]